MRTLFTAVMIVGAVVLALWLYSIVAQLLFWGLIIGVIVFVVIPLLSDKPRRR